jgi:protease-4
MSFEADLMLDRRRLKRRLVLWRSLFVVALLLAALFAAYNLDLFGTGPRVARIELNGVLLDSEKRTKALDKLAKDADVRALIVRINSPGGTFVGGETAYLDLRRVAEKKPVVAVMGTLATSAGYMAALGADRIFARRGTVTGSIGVLLQTTDVSGMLDKIGVKAEAIKTSPLKAAPSPLEPLTDEVRAATQAVVDDMYDAFVAMVAERRGLDDAAARTVSDGRVFTGAQALDNKLVDAIGGEREAREWLQTAHDIAASLPVDDVAVDEAGSLWSGARRAFSGKMLFSERLTLDGLISLWQPDLGS